MSVQFKCPSCAAPLSVTVTSPLLQCTYCGAHLPMPAEIREDPLWRRHNQRHELAQWYETTRQQYMERDGNGNLQPPSKDSTVGLMLSMTGMILAFGTSAFCFFAGILFFPLWFLLPFTFFGFFFGFSIPGTAMMQKAKERYKSFHAVEAEYKHRLAQLDAVASTTTDPRNK